MKRGSYLPEFSKVVSSLLLPIAVLVQVGNGRDGSYLTELLSIPRDGSYLTELLSTLRDGSYLTELLSILSLLLSLPRIMGIMGGTRDGSYLTELLSQLLPILVLDGSYLTELLSIPRDGSYLTELLSILSLIFFSPAIARDFLSTVFEPFFKILDTLQALIFSKFVKEATPGNKVIFTILRQFFPCWTFNVRGSPITIVSRAADMREVLSQSIVFGNTYRDGMDAAFDPGFFMMARDGHEPEHDHEKSIMKSLLLREDIPKVKEMAFSLAMKNLQEVAVGDECNAIDLLSKKVPIQICDKFFGFEPPDYDTMSLWSDNLQGSFFYNDTSDPESPYSIESGGKIGKEARDYIRNVLLPKKRKALKENPDLGDAVSRMLRTIFTAEAKFDEERVVANTLGLLVGCVETNNNTILKSLDRLLAMPKIMAMAREAAETDDDEKLIKIVWESLRWNAPSLFLPRIVTEDYTMNGHTFKKGTRVVCLHRSAFFDPDWVDNPNEFSLDRPYHIVPAFHFGHGCHMCLGEYVAGVVTPMVIKAILLYKPGVERVRTKVGEFQTIPGTVFTTNYWIKFSDTNRKVIV